MLRISSASVPAQVLLSTEQALVLRPAAGRSTILDSEVATPEPLIVANGTGDIAAPPGGLRVHAVPSGTTSRSALDLEQTSGPMQQLVGIFRRSYHSMVMSRRPSAAGPPSVLLDINRQQPLPGLFVNNMFGPWVGAPGTLTEDLTWIGDERLSLKADRSVVAGGGGGPNAGLTAVASDGSNPPQAGVFAGLFNPAAASSRISIGLSGGSAGVLRVGDFSGTPGAGGPPVFNDRLRLAEDGTFTVYDPGSVGSPGSVPALTFEPTNAEAMLALGTRTVSGRGQVRVDADPALGKPALLVQEAADGTPIYWSAWRVGAQVEVIVSSVPPTSAASGTLLVAL